MSASPARMALRPWRKMALLSAIRMRMEALEFMLPSRLYCTAIPHANWLLARIGIHWHGPLTCRALLHIVGRILFGIRRRRRRGRHSRRLLFLGTACQQARCKARREQDKRQEGKDARSSRHRTTPSTEKWEREKRGARDAQTLSLPGGDQQLPGGGSRHRRAHRGSSRYYRWDAAADRSPAVPAFGT